MPFAILPQGPRVREMIELGVSGRSEAEDSPRGNSKSGKCASDAGAGDFAVVSGR